MAYIHFCKRNFLSLKRNECGLSTRNILLTLCFRLVLNAMAVLLRLAGNTSFSDAVVLKISRLCEELDLLAPDDWLMRMRLYEKVADYAAKIVQFQLAIEHYQKMVTKNNYPFMVVIRNNIFVCVFMVISYHSKLSLVVLRLNLHTFCIFCTCVTGPVLNVCKPYNTIYTTESDLF